MIYKSGVGYDQLEDLIAGVVPTLVDWTNDPTDSADITDDDISTFCTTGNKVIGAGWQYAYFEWDLGSFYNVLCGGVGQASATVGVGYVYPTFWDGAAWTQVQNPSVTGTNVRIFDCVAARGSKVRLGITGDTAATLTPNFREFHVWRL